MKTNDLIPKISIGDIRFDANVAALIALGYTEDVEGFDDFLNWHTYRKDADIACYVKDDSVISVACFANCTFNGDNLIGKCVNDLISILGAPNEIGESVWVDEDRKQIPYEYFDAGLQVWFENGYVVSVFCNSEY